MSSGWRVLLALAVVFVIVLAVMSLVLGSGSRETMEVRSDPVGIVYPQPPPTRPCSSSALTQPRSLLQQMRDDNSRLIEAS